MQNQKLYIGVLIGVLLLVGSVYAFDYLVLMKKGAYTFLIESDKDNVFDRLLYVREVKGDKEFYRIIDYLISSQNTDMLTQESAVRFIRENSRKEFLPDLLRLKSHLSKIDPDSIWDTKIDESRGRSNRLRNSVLLSNLNSTIDTFKLDTLQQP